MSGENLDRKSWGLEISLEEDIVPEIPEAGKTVTSILQPVLHSGIYCTTVMHVHGPIYTATHYRLAGVV